jgi:hypothetical protein
MSPFLADGRIRRAQLAWAGPDDPHLQDPILAADSDAAVKIIAAYPGDAGHAARFRLAIRAMALFLEDIGLDGGAAALLAQRLREERARNHGVGREVEAALSARYRLERATVEAALAAVDDPALEPGFQALAARSRAIERPLAELRGRTHPEQLSLLVGKWMAGTVNRILRTGREETMVLYDFLARALRSRCARSSGLEEAN